MKLTTSVLVTVASLPLLVAARDLHGARHLEHAKYARQAPPPESPPPAPSPTSSAPPPPPSGQLPSSSSASSTPPSGLPSSGVTSGTVNGTSTSTPTFTFSLQSTNPTAVPLSAIVSGVSASPTLPIASTYPAGSQPTYLPGAPPLPNVGLLKPGDYPALDKPPPTDSPEVQQWIQDVANTGIEIPDFEPTVLGGCPANPEAVADTSRCWWTCGGCTRDTDITTCPDKLTWGLTYDDGPAFYTSNLLNYLDEKDLKSTFFVVGSRVISFPAVLQAQYMDQHQIAVHTWSHPQLTTLSNEEIIAELGWSKKVIKDVLGVTPNMMRPPFGDIDDRVRAIATAMGLTPVMWTRISPVATFDTDDFNIAGGVTSVGQVLQNWENILGNSTQIDTGFIVLEHDLFQQSVEVATGYILPDALAHQPSFNIKPVISCLNMPMTDAYIETNDNTTNPPIVTMSIDPPINPSSTALGSAKATSAAGSGGKSNSNGGSTSQSGSSSSSSSATRGLNLNFSVGLGLTVFTAFAGLVAGATAFL